VAIKGNRHSNASVGDKATSCGSFEIVSLQMSENLIPKKKGKMYKI